MNKTNQRQWGIILSYVVMASNFIIGLLYTPFLIRNLGQSEYGNYNYVYSIVNYLNLLTFGFGSAYLRFSSPYKNNKDKKGVEDTNGLFLLLFLLMGGIAFVLGVSMTLNSDVILSGKLSEEELHTGKVLMAILAANVFMTFPISVFNSFVIAQEEFVFQKAMALVRTILAPSISTIVLYVGYKAVGIAIVTLIVTLIVDITTIVFCITKLNMRFSFDMASISHAKEVFVFSSFLLISMVVDQINWSVDKFILGKICGTVAVAIYSVGATINQYYMTMGEAISNVYVPKVYDLLNQDDGDYKATVLMTRLGRVQLLVLGLIITGFVSFGKPFIQLWVGNDYMMSYYVILLLIIPVTIPEIQKIGLEIQKAKNKHKFRSVVYSIIAVTNIVFTIPLARIYGPIGAAISTSITVLLGNGIIMNLYYQKKVGVNIHYFWSQIIRVLPALMISLSIGMLINHIIAPNSWFKLIICILSFTLVYCMIAYMLALNIQEKNLLRKIVHVAPLKEGKS